MANKLADATSPYLLQHKDNPVFWYPWGEEAFQAARDRDVPLLLSVGYAACHWCHVMAHESFEDPETAHLMNERFVNVKVDREERPDVDAVYMAATTAMTGHGGWPMTCFLTPDGEPFYCGTYFPPDDRHGMPSFRRVLLSVAEAWGSRRDDVVAQGRQVVTALAERGRTPAPDGRRMTEEVLDAAAASLASAYDEQRGGFGGAPKFPPAMALEFLLRHHARTGDERSLAIVEGTCERMARGGLYDQLAGGFARYSVDAAWVVPHFEKMLYDNALLLRLYAHLWRTTGSELARRVASETADWLLAELWTAEGGFASSLDADTEGEEGRYYVWTPDEVGPYAAELFGVTDAGTFEHGRSVLQLSRDPDDPGRYAQERARLRALREQRVRPGRDDKVVASWNGLAIAALAEAGVLLDRIDLVTAAQDAADLLLRVHLVDARLRRTSRDGAVGTNAGVLDDYGNVADGLLTLHQVTGEQRWLAAAGQLLDVVLARFGDGRGGFYDTADDAERLVRRPQDPSDSPTPSGLSAAAGALVTYAALTGEHRYREAADEALGVVVPIAQQQAQFAGWAAAVGEAAVAGPTEIAVVGDRDARREVERAARLATLPGAVVVAGEPGSAASPLLADRRALGDRPTVYICHGFVCERPLVDLDQVRDRLRVTAPA